MKQVDRAWLAGIIDGEGCIGIYKRKPKRGRVQYILQITMSMTCKDTMDRVVSLCGMGTIQHKKGNTSNSKDFYYWCVAAQNAKKFLRIIQPYIFTKKKQLELGLQLQNRIDNCQAYAGKPIPNRELAIRERMKLRMNKLNKRGIK